MATLHHQDRDSLAGWGLAFLRIAVGTIFLAHGSQKLFVYGVAGVAQGFGQMGLPMPYLSATLATAAEFGGGLLLVLGLFTRFAAVPLAITMLVAGLTVHRKAFLLPAGVEYVLVLFAANVLFLLAGPGKLALDNLIWKRRRSDGEPHSVIAKA
jgi:putative oxidoreductase